MARFDSERRMVDNICKVVDDYEKSLQEMSCVPRFSYGSRMLREDDNFGGDV